MGLSQPQVVALSFRKEDYLKNNMFTSFMSHETGDVSVQLQYSAQISSFTQCGCPVIPNRAPSIIMKGCAGVCVCVVPRLVKQDRMSSVDFISGHFLKAKYSFHY